MSVNITVSNTPIGLSITNGTTQSVSIPVNNVSVSISPIAAGIGVPSGGNDGQVLAKASNADYDTEWISGSGAAWGGISGDIEDQTDLDSYLTSLERIASTGLVVGGDLSIDVGSTTFTVAAGIGVVYDNYTDPENPTRTVVTWPEYTGVVPTYISADTFSIIGIDITGTIAQRDSNGFTAEDRRDHIVLGWVDHVDHSYIDDVRLEPDFPIGVYSQLNDFLLAFGPFNVQGNEYGPHTLLALSRTSGRVFFPGSNYVDSKASPNIIDTDAENSCPIYYSYRTGPGVWENVATPTTDIDPNYYDTGSGLAAVPAGEYSIQFITYYAQWNSTDIQYGQATYATLEEAVAAVTTVIELNPYNDGSDVSRAWLCVKQGTTDLNVAADAQFVSCGRLGIISASGGGGVGGTTNADNIGSAGDGVYHSKIADTLYFKKLNATLPLTISNVTSASRLDVGINVVNSTQNGYLSYTDFNAFGSKAASDHSHGNPTLALTNISGTTASASNGLTLSLSGNASFNSASCMNTSERGNYFYTSNNTFANSTHSHGNPTLALTNLSGTTASASSGLTISISAGNYLTTAMASNEPHIRAAVFSDATQNSGTLYFTGSNGISIGSGAGGSVVVSLIDNHHVDGFLPSGGGYGTGFSSMTSGTVNLNAVGMLSFSQNGNALSMSVPSAMLTSERGNYFYTSNNTFANSTHSHGNPTLALTNISGTTNSASNGLTISLSAAVGGGGDGYNILAAGGSTAAQSATIVLSNSNGISFGLNGSTLTASHNALTTAAASDHSHGNPTLALTNLTGTTASASNGFTLSLSAGVGGGGGIALAASNTTYTSGTAYMSGVNATIASSVDGASQYVRVSVPAVSTLTYASPLSISTTGSTISLQLATTDFAAVGHSHGNPTLALTNLSGTTASASNGFTLSLSAAVGGGGDGYNILAVPGTTAAQSATIVLSNSNGISFGINGSTITGSHNGLTTAAASDHSHGNPTLALTNVNGTTASASNGLTISLSVSNYLTTAAQSDHSHGNPTLALTNLTGTTASASNGFTLSLSGNPAGGGAAATLSSYEPWPMHNTGTAVISGLTATSGSATFIPFYLEQNVAVHMLDLVMSVNFTTGGTSAFSQSRTFQYGVYSRLNQTGSQLLSMSTNSFSVGVSYNNSTISISAPTATSLSGFAYAQTSSAGINVSSLYSGLKVFNLPVGATLTAGQYWLGLFNRASTAGFNSGVLWSHYGNSLTAITGLAPFNQFSSAWSTGTNQLRIEANWYPAMGVYTVAGQVALQGTITISNMTRNVPVLPYLRMWSTA